MILLTKKAWSFTYPTSANGRARWGHVLQWTYYMRVGQKVLKAKMAATPRGDRDPGLERIAGLSWPLFHGLGRVKGVVKRDLKT